MADLSIGCSPTLSEHMKTSQSYSTIYSPIYSVSAIYTEVMETDQKYIYGNRLIRRSGDCAPEITLTDLSDEHGSRVT